MERKQFNEKAQMMTLEALIASLLIIASVLFVASQVPPQAPHGASYSNMQLKHYGEDILNILTKSPSQHQDYDNLLQYYIGENDYGDLKDLLENSLPDNVGYSAALFSGTEREELFSNGYPTGEQVVVGEIVVSRNVGIGGISGAAAGVRKVEKTFPAGSLIIPMDDSTDTDGTAQNDILAAMGLVYNISNGTYSKGTPISVWEILQDPRGESVTFFDTRINTSTDPLNSSVNNAQRYYAGGPYLIDATDLTPEIRQQIINASNIEFITLHQLVEDFTSYITVELTLAPRIAAYPPDDPTGTYMNELNNTISNYYQDSGVPFTVINDSMIMNGDLDDFDIVTIPHANLTPMPDNVTKKLIDWVSNGGVIHAECLSITTLDDKVEAVDGNLHSWHGFIGIENGVSYTKFSWTGLPYDNGRSMIFVGNDSIAYDNDSLAYSNSSLYGDYANPGSCFDVLSQSGDKNGRLPQSRGAYVPSLKLIRYPNNSINYQKINPDLTILAGAGFLNQSELSNVDYNNITYVAAPFDKGLVTYLAGHNMSVDESNNPTPHKERLMFHTFFYPGFAKIYDYGVVELQITMWYK
ncbi:MAG: hypothetical protein P1P80_09285 [ANME-2 cluster archaeon]|nr:hypothetical protein [ANME-2 cluster archaeon]